MLIFRIFFILLFCNFFIFYNLNVIANTPSEKKISTFFGHSDYYTNTKTKIPRPNLYKLKSNESLNNPHNPQSRLQRTYSSSSTISVNSIDSASSATSIKYTPEETNDLQKFFVLTKNFVSFLKTELKNEFPDQLKPIQTRALNTKEQLNLDSPINSEVEKLKKYKDAKFQASIAVLSRKLLNFMNNNNQSMRQKPNLYLSIPKKKIIKFFKQQATSVGAFKRQLAVLSTNQTSQDKLPCAGKLAFR